MHRAGRDKTVPTGAVRPASGVAAEIQGVIAAAQRGGQLGRRAQPMRAGNTEAAGELRRVGIGAGAQPETLLPGISGCPCVFHGTVAGVIGLHTVQQLRRQRLPRPRDIIPDPKRVRLKHQPAAVPDNAGQQRQIVPIRLCAAQLGMRIQQLRRNAVQQHLLAGTDSLLDAEQHIKIQPFSLGSGQLIVCFIGSDKIRPGQIAADAGVAVIKMIGQHHAREAGGLGGSDRVDRIALTAGTAIGGVLVVTGYLIAGTTVETKILFPFGLVYPGFASSDYFPLLPHLGWYMLGTVIGRTAYREKKTRLPGKAQDLAVTRFFCFCGRQSLWIYLLHQPVVYGLLQLVLILTK